MSPELLYEYGRTMFPRIWMRSAQVSMLPEADCHDLLAVDFGPGRTAQGTFVTTGPVLFLESK